MKVTYISHPDVIIDPEVPVARWPLSKRGRARMTTMLELSWIAKISAVYCSTEQKALDGADILGRHLNLDPQVREDLGENDRTATGYLEQEAFLAHVGKFFGRPEESVEGWEPAQGAQDRITGAVRSIASHHAKADHVAIVAHGGVGALLLTSLMGKPISMEQEQPGKTGGNYFNFDAATWELSHGWHPVDP